MVKVNQFDNFGVETMSPDQTKNAHEEIMTKCKCTECPTFVEGNEPQGYCFPVVGTSSVIKHEKDCICTTCPVYKDYELSHTFYCTRCSQLCQAYKLEAGAGHE